VASRLRRAVAPVPEAPQRLLRRTWVRRALPAAAVAVIVVAGTVVTRVNANASPIDTYRTTTATTGSVEQRLNLTGSVQRVNQMSQSFAVTGTVSTVKVSVGDTVTAGQVLATLDPAPLRRALTSATASLAKAQATLESDQSSTATATSSASTTTGTSSTTRTAATPVATPVATATPTTTARTASPSVRSDAGASLARAQRRVTGAQRAITADLRRASAALAQCAPFFPSESSPAAPSPTSTSTPTATTTTADPSPTSTSTPTASTTTAATAVTRPSTAQIRECVGALRTAPTQQQIQRDQQELTDSQASLMTTVTLAITTTSSTANTRGTTSRSTTSGQSATSPSSTNQSSSSRSTSIQSSANQSSGGLTGGTGQSGASRAVSDQAAVTNAQAALSRAQADLTSVTLKSSIGGTVGSVSLTNGASSQGKSVVIVGVGAVEVTVNVPLASIGTVQVGQQANVTPQGATSTVAGSVASISLLPATSSTTGTGSGAGQGTSSASSPTYPVVVLVPDALPALASGSRADVSLLIGTVSKVLTVPNSALTPLAKGQAMALTLKDGVATRALVKTGYAGTLTTQVTSGLTAGQQVVLADLSTALPTNTTNSRRFGIGGGATGGLGGAGLGGSSFGGGTTRGGTGFPSRG
jgi:multidrug resistance efflux pump